MRLETATRNRTLINQLVSYVVIVIIPVIVLSIIIFNYFFKIIEDEVVNNNLINLEKIKTSIDSKLLDANRAAYQIFLNPSLQKLKKEYEPLSALAIKNELAKFVIANAFVQEIYLYPHNTDYLFSSTTTPEFSRFCDMYRISPDFRKELHDSMNGGSQIKYFSADTIGNKEQRIIVCVFPEVIRNLDINRSIILILSEEAIINFIKRDGIIVYLEDSQKNIIVQYPIDNNVNIMPANELGYGRTFYEGDEYYSFAVNSHETNWTYHALVKKELVLSKVNNAKNVFIFCLIIILVLSAFGIRKSMVINYAPIRQLRIFAEKLSSKDLANMNEVDAIHSALDDIDEDKKMLSKKVEDLMPAVHDFLMYDLIKGNIQNESVFLSSAQSCGLYFAQNKEYIVTVALLGQKHIIADFSLDMERFDHALMLPEKNMLVFVLTNEDFDNKLYSITRRLSEITKVTFGVGTSVKGLIWLWRSYTEAIAALDYRFILGNGNTIFFNKIKDYEFDINIYPRQKLQNLLSSFKNSDPTVAQNAATELIEHIKEYKLPIHLARSICFEIINAIIKALYEIRGPAEAINNMEFNVMSLMQFDTIDELLHASNNFFMFYFKEKERRPVGERDERMSQIIAYVNQNFTSINFSIKEMASNLNMTQSALSQYFKTHTKENISEYISRLQIEKAKKLLCETDLRLQEIVLSVGHCDVSNFIRKFKSKVGVTMGEYRKLHRQGMFKNDPPTI